MDTATAKALLQSSDVSQLQNAAVQAAKDFNSTPNDQLWKFQLLLYNRILQLQKQAGADESTIAKTLKDTALVWWNQAGDADRAAGQLRQAVTLNDDVALWQLLGSCYMSSSKYNEAIEAHKSAISKIKDDNDLPDAYGQLAGVYDAQSNFDEAIATLNKAIDSCKEENEDKAKLIAQRGTLYEKLGEYEKAIESLSAAVDAYTNILGADHAKTQEVAFLLEMAQSLSG